MALITDTSPRASFGPGHRAAAEGNHRPEYRRPIGADDPTFLSISDELADRGFLLTSADELINWARTGSLMWMTSGSPAAPSR